MKPYLVLAIMMMILVGCEFGMNSEDKEISFMPDIYPYVDTIYSNHNNQTPFYDFGQNKNKKILFYTNGDCGACFHQIKQWQEFININKGQIEGISYALVIQTDNLSRLEYNLEKINNSIPIYIDTDNSFSIYNSIQAMQPQTFVLDEHNNIKYHTAKLNFKSILRSLK